MVDSVLPSSSLPVKVSAPAFAIYVQSLEASKISEVFHLVATVNTGIQNVSKTTVCGGNSATGFSYQFNQNDKVSYQGKDIHIKALTSGKELWLYKPANFVVPIQ